MDKSIEKRIEEVAIGVGNNCAEFYGNDVDYCCIEDGLRQIATEQKAIDEADLQTAKQTYFDAGYETAKNKMIDKAKKAFCDTCMGQCKDRTHCDTLQRFMNELKALED